MRLFIAIPLAENIKSALTAVQQEMQSQNMRGSYTPAENMHLTLAFIGEWSDPDTVMDALPEFTPFELTLQGIGAFQDVWWAGILPSEPLNAYVKALRRSLTMAGIPFDKKRFSPHITLIRRAIGHPAGISVPGISMQVRHISLMRSDRGKRGMIYTGIGGIDAG